MIQTLEIISVNLWQILISLVNLLLIFLILKKVLYRPVKDVMARRQSAIDEQYDAANDARREAEQSRDHWQRTMDGARAQADDMLQSATDAAKLRADAIVAEARQRADGIVRTAEQEAVLERQKATDDIKREIIEVSGAIAEKMLAREINTEDHGAMIDAMIDAMVEPAGEDNDADR